MGNKVVKEMYCFVEKKVVDFYLSNTIETVDEERQETIVRSYWTSENLNILEFVCAVKTLGKSIDFDTLEVECLFGVKEIDSKHLIDKIG